MSLRTGRSSRAAITAMNSTTRMNKGLSRVFQCGCSRTHELLALGQGFSTGHRPHRGTQRGNLA